MCNRILGRLGPVHFDRLTFGDIVTGTSGIDRIVDQVTFTQICKSGILQDNVLKGQLLAACCILVRRTILIIIIGSGLFVVLQSRTIMLKGKFNSGCTDRIISVSKGNLCICELEVRSLIIVIVSRGISGALKTLLQTIIGLALLGIGVLIVSDILGELCCLTVAVTGKAAAEVRGIILCYPVIDEEGATIMTQNCVPLCCQHEVGRAGTTNTAQLLDLIPILYHYHETGNSVVQGTVHDLIYYICICHTEMRKCGLLVIYHYGDRALILQALIDPFIGKLTAVHTVMILIGFLCCTGLFNLLDISSNRLCFHSLDRGRNRFCVSTSCQNTYCNQNCCKYFLFHECFLSSVCSNRSSDRHSKIHCISKALCLSTENS